ncbi:glycoside hydrolase family 76 protein [Acidomyces richmondensis BFW]|nr:MAG: glycoside hydrolase family 76 protein [Acidomyces sp. 'richmondensis']KYG43813.1 glycoside hydrolase family 76 protein [Acidomyces richmondensis BFW]
MRLSPLLGAGLLGLGARLAHAISLDITSSESLKSASSTVAYGMMSYYSGNQSGNVPGNLPPPYYWWECGGMFGHMVEYWYYTGDTSYNEATTQALVWQAGSDGSFMPANQTQDEGNDDQVFWGFAAMTAAELNYPAAGGGAPSWLSMAQAVFNTQANRWDTSTCGGGLRWQIYQLNSGYNYKNPAANGGFFQLAARLARYTGNQSYITWAEKEWDWFSSSVLFDSSSFNINDGTNVDQNCTSADHLQWSYNYGLYIAGMAYLYNHTQDQKWLTPMQGLLNHCLNEFFPQNKVMQEVQCESTNNCDADQLSFKSFMMRWLALTAQLVPSTASTIWPYLQACAQAAAGQCDGGSDGVTCGFKWTQTTWDGTYGVGQQMDALAAFGANLITLDNLKPPYTSDNGGTSKGNPSAGTGTTDGNVGKPGVATRVITTGDRAGAGILTALSLILTLGGATWMVIGK